MLGNLIFTAGYLKWGDHMTLSDLAAIGSFISGIGVIASLIYLGYQTRQSALTHRAGAYQGRLDFIRQGLRDSMDPEFASLTQRVNAGDETLTDVECMRYFAYQLSFFLGFDHLSWLHANRILDEELFRADSLVLQAQLSQPGARATWEISKGIQTSRFRDQVEKYLADTTATPSGPTAQEWRSHWRAASARAATPSA
jgi:hypothetical protein